MQTNIYVSWSTSELRVRLFKPSNIFTGRSKAVLLLWIPFCELCYYALLQPCDTPIAVSLHPRTIFHGCQILNWEPLDAKRRCSHKHLAWAM